jgi:type I restriction enzyme M protein
VASLKEVLAANGNLSIARYVKRPKTVMAPGATTLAATWAAFDDEGRNFWLGVDALVDMLDGLTPAEEADA